MTKRIRRFTQEDWAKDLYLQAKERAALLENAIMRAESALMTLPEGKLRDVRHRDGYQYYLRKDAGDSSGKYISKSNIDIVKGLAQKEYLHNFNKAATAELHALNKYIAVAEQTSVSGIYANMREARRIHVKPFIIPDKDYIELWEKEEYEPGFFKPGAPEHYTMKKERVRSKSEINIANMLKANGIPYKYEYPITVGGEIRRPDFCCLNVRKKKEIIWEHFGMMDNTEYAIANVIKINKMILNGYTQGDDFIFTFETSIQPINTKEIQMMIDKFLK